MLPGGWLSRVTSLSLDGACARRRHAGPRKPAAVSGIYRGRGQHPRTAASIHLSLWLARPGFHTFQCPGAQAQPVPVPRPLSSRPLATQHPPEARAPFCSRSTLLGWPCPCMGSQHKSHCLPESLPQGPAHFPPCAIDGKLSPAHICVLASAPHPQPREKQLPEGGARQPPPWQRELQVCSCRGLSSRWGKGLLWGAGTSTPLPTRISPRSAAFQPGRPRQRAVVLARPRRGWESGINHGPWGPLLGPARRLPGRAGPGGPAAPLVVPACAPSGKALHTALLAGSGEFLPVCG